jgi:hypothetical protein
MIGKTLANGMTSQPFSLLPCAGFELSSRPQPDVSVLPETGGREVWSNPAVLAFGFCLDTGPNGLIRSFLGPANADLPEPPSAGRGWLSEARSSSSCRCVGLTEEMGVWNVEEDAAGW